MLPTQLSREEEFALALSIAEQLANLQIRQALYILQDLTPAMINNSHTVSKEPLIAARERLAEGGSF